MKRLSLLFFYCYCNCHCFSQLPDTEIWLIQLKDSAGTMLFKNPQNITKRPGYDNQASFSPDSKSILYTSVRDSQSDIYRYDIKSKKTTRLTQTVESEYSPTYMPDGKNISTVRVERDSTQRLWKFPVSGKPEFSLVMDKVKGVGYHAWLGPDSLALFLLTQPFSLQLFNVKKQIPDTLAFNPGRCFGKLYSHNFIYVEKENSEFIPDTIRLFDPRSKKVYQSFAAVKGAEDFVVMTVDVFEGKGYYNALFMCKGSELFRQWIGQDKEWKKVADFSGMGIENVTRIAISPDNKWLTVISNKK